MRLVLLLAATVAALLVTTDEASAQPRGDLAWYLVQSADTPRLVRARTVRTRPGPAGRVRVLADDERFRLPGPVTVVPLGTSEEPPPPETYASTSSESMVVLSGNRAIKTTIEVDGKTVTVTTTIWETDDEGYQTGNTTTTTTTTTEDGTTTTTTTTQTPSEGEEEGEGDS